MQPNNRSLSKPVSRPTQNQARLGLALLLQQVLRLVEEAKEVEAREVPKGLAGDRPFTPAASVSSVSLPETGMELVSVPSAPLVYLNGADQRLMAEVLLDVKVGEDRYLLLRSTAAVVDEQILSPREREIVRLVARGYPNKTIAEVLEISPWTVNTYLRRIFSKLDVTSRAEMVAHSLVIGLLQNTG